MPLCCYCMNAFVPDFLPTEFTLLIPPLSFSGFYAEGSCHFGELTVT